MIKIKEFKKGTIALLVKDVEEKVTKNGKQYLAYTLSDGEKEIFANQWDATKNAAIEKGNIGDFDMEVGTYNNQPSYTITKNPILNTFEDKSKFIPTAPVEAKQMYDEMVKVIQEFTNKDLMRITGNILQDNRAKLMKWSAAKSVHHNVVAGLLYHMYRMMKSAIAMADIYPVNRDLLIAGVLLHDIGKIAELDTDEFGNTTYTVDGNLFGHLYIGAEMVHDYGVKFETDPEIVRNLKHIILSHHGKLEWEAVKVPCTMEASLVSELDMIDSRIYQFEKLQAEIAPGSVNEQRMYSLDGAHVYRPSFEK